MSEGMIIACCPVDTAGLPMQDHLPKPSIEHTVIACPTCGRDMWIGPAQLEHMRGAGFPARCYWCVFASGYFDSDVQIVSLDPDADDIPRRT